MVCVPKKDAWPDSGQEEPISISESETPGAGDPESAPCRSVPQPARIAEIRTAAQNAERKKPDPLGIMDESFH
jgi:hypothetical protein